MKNRLLKSAGALAVVATMLAASTAAFADIVYTDIDKTSSTTSAKINVQNNENWILGDDVTVETTNTNSSSIGGTGNGKVTIQAGGSLLVAGPLKIGDAAGNNGVVDVWGTMRASGFSIGTGGGVGVVNQYDGTVSATNGNVTIGFGGTYRIEGGELLLNVAAAQGRDTSVSGRLEVVGSNSEIRINVAVDEEGIFSYPAGGKTHIYGTVAFEADANGVSTILNRSLYFYEGSKVELSFNDAFTNTMYEGQTLTLFTKLENTTAFKDMPTLNVAGDSTWELQQVVVGSTRVVQAVCTEVPEPATMGLLGLGLVGLIARKKRR